MRMGAATPMIAETLRMECLLVFSNAALGIKQPDESRWDNRFHNALTFACLGAEIPSS